MPMSPMAPEVLDAIGTAPAIAMIAAAAIVGTIALLTGRRDGTPPAARPIDETIGDDHPSLWTFP